MCYPKFWLCCGGHTNMISEGLRISLWSCIHISWNQILIRTATNLRAEESDNENRSTRTQIRAVELQIRAVKPSYFSAPQSGKLDGHKSVTLMRGCDRHNTGYLIVFIFLYDSILHSRCTVRVMQTVDLWAVSTQHLLTSWLKMIHQWACFQAPWPLSSLVGQSKWKLAKERLQESSIRLKFWLLVSTKVCICAGLFKGNKKRFKSNIECTSQCRDECRSKLEI